MNEIVQRRSITADMAEKFGMETPAFESTIKATIFYGKGTKEEMATFLLVAKQYDLNPVTKEIYAFPSRGGIIPVVSVDGWIKLINSHPMMDGMEFVDHHDDKGELVSVTCSLWRKDRSRPAVVSEYLAECFRPTEPWKMKHRMLRHKALIQCARYAFGFAGIYDPDEGERIQIARRLNSPPKATTLRERMPLVESFDPDTGEITETAGEAPPTSSASGAGVPVSPVPEGAVVGSFAAAPTYSTDSPTGNDTGTETVWAKQRREKGQAASLREKGEAIAKNGDAALIQDAAYLRNMGQDPGPTLGDIDKPRSRKEKNDAYISLKGKGDAVAKNGEAALDQWIEEWIDPKDRASVSDDLLAHWRAIAKENTK